MPAIDKVADTGNRMGIMILYFLGSLAQLNSVLHNILIKK